MNEDERRIRLKLKNDLKHYATKCLKIRTKNGSIEPFAFNKAQLYIHELIERQLLEAGKVRAIILKGRQQGCSTYVGARFYHKVTHSFGTQSFILAHELNATNNLFKMAKRFYEHTPNSVRPEISTSNSKELVFGGLDSGYKLGTSENPNVGRSATIQMLHGSEIGFWKNEADHSTGIMQAVPNARGTEIILESTANGVGNYFHQEWQKAEGKISEYIAIFVPWFWQEEYVKDVQDFERSADEQSLAEQYGLNDKQLAWRRAKIIELSVAGVDGEKSFKQEYPMNSTEAFQLTGEDNYVPSNTVMKARKNTDAEKYGPLVLGVDPARFGDDRTSIIRRQGRVAFGLESYTKKDTMEVAGIVHSIIGRESPVRVFVDVGGLGAGVVDRLFELGHRDIVVGVNAGSTPLDARQFFNKRSEMWATCKEWLQDEPCQIPDSDSLHADLCGIRYRIDSNSRLVMEQKAEMKKRGIRSCDEADSLCLTFAIPEKALHVKSTHNDKIKSIASTLANQMRAKKTLTTTR